MARPDYIPDGKKWNDTAQAFQDLDAHHIDDLQKLYDQAKGKIVSLEAQVKDLESRLQEAVVKNSPPAQAARMVALEKEKTTLAEKLEELTKALEEANMKVFAKESKAKKAIKEKESVIK